MMGQQQEQVFALMLIALSSPCASSFTAQETGRAFVFLPTAHQRPTRIAKPKTSLTFHAVSLSHQTDDVDQPTQEWDVSRYQEQHSFVYEYGSSLIDLANPVAGERILDVGCGSGELTAALYERCCLLQASDGDDMTTVFGMDADPHMVAKAQEQFPNNVTFFQADVRNFNLRDVNNQDSDDNRVDLLFSNAALHWIGPGNGERAVACMARAMKPGARFVVEFGGKGNVEQIARACTDVTGVPNFWYFPSIAEFSGLLERQGIEVTSAMLYDRPTVLEEGEEGLKNWVRMFGNKFLEGLAPDEIEDALEQISHKARPTLFNGTNWIADYRRIRVVGRKIES